MLASGVALVLGLFFWGTAGLIVWSVDQARGATEFGTGLPSFDDPPEAADDDFRITEVYDVGADGILSPEPSAEAAAAWAEIERVFTPRVAATRISRLEVGDDSRSDTMAWVSREDTPEYWTFAANLAYADDDTWLPTLVHEYAHVLSLGPESADIYADTCDTIWTGQGCLLPETALYAFSDRFWSAYPDAPTADNVDADVADEFYAAHEDDFVDAYAATNVTEDFAESFMTYVLEEQPTGGGTVSDKLRFFAEYPPYVQIRERLRTEFDLG
ncbi:MAG: NADH:ubiquinone oxidoreductase subunit 4 [Microbacterium sp.]|nr:NADH:ubiquinone oxidoreductase subunit 4 [Microbacterium sp.]